MFEPKNSQTSQQFQPPLFGPEEEQMYFDPEEGQQAGFMTIFVGLILGSWMLGLAEGTLAWIALESLEDIGVIDQRVAWWPVVVIAVALNMIRFLDYGFRSAIKRS